MRSLLNKIPLPNDKADKWCGHALPPNFIEIKSREAQAWFVDGGNASILEAPHFSLQKLRAVAVHYPSKKIIRKENLALIVRTKEGWKVHFDDSQDVTNITLAQASEIAEAISIAREKIENAVSFSALEQKSGLVIMDGDKPLNGAISLQKSITVLTENNFPLSSVLTKKGPWAALLGEIYAVKLHPRARHVFLVYNAKIEDLEVLAFYSRDALFPGYPGGLVLADRLARVSNEEAQALKIKARSQLRELRERVSQAEASSDSHSILDSIG